MPCLPQLEVEIEFQLGSACKLRGALLGWTEPYLELVGAGAPDCELAATKRLRELVDERGFTDRNSHCRRCVLRFAAESGPLLSVSSPRGVRLEPPTFSARR